MLAGILSVIGLAIAGYLTYVHYAGLHPLCLASGGCETVQSSKYAILFGVPVPVIGLIGYALILGSLFIRGEIGRLLGLCIAVGGFAFSMYLTYLEASVIHAWCWWCVGSAVTITALGVVMIVRYLTPPMPAEGTE